LHKVNLSNISNKLRRVIAILPQKAILPGMLTCIVLSCGVPIMAGWMGNNKAGNTKQSHTARGTVVVRPGVSTSTPVSTAQGVKSDRPSWQQVIERMDKDPRTMIAPPLTNRRDPFEPLKPGVGFTKPEIGRELNHPAPVSATLGLMLDSTILGPQRRIAQINGKSYIEGQMIEVVGEKNPRQTKFKLKEVSPSRVILESDEGPLELTIPEPGTSEKSLMTGTVGAGS
jgi:hypothetical protein